jgi:hypothetical protein
MFKRIFFLGIGASVLASIASIIYNRMHFFATYADFSKIVNIRTIIGANLLGSMLAVLGYWLMKKWMRSNVEIIFNFTFTILSFASVLVAFSFKLPYDVQYPELFPGLTVPMHFFPALAWFTLKPAFFRTRGNEN